MPNFESQLTKSGYTTTTVSKNVQKRIKDYYSLVDQKKDYEDAVVTLTAELDDATTKPGRAKKIPAEITTMKQSLVDIDADISAADSKIVTDIQRLEKNGYGKGGAYDKMRAGLKKPGTKTEPAAPAAEPVAATEPADTPTPDPQPAPPKPELKKADPPPPKQNPRNQPPATPAAPKKKDNTLVIALSVIGVAIAGFFGYRAWKGRQ